MLILLVRLLCKTDFPIDIFVAHWKGSGGLVYGGVFRKSEGASNALSLQNSNKTRRMSDT